MLYPNHHTSEINFEIYSFERGKDIYSIKRVNIIQQLFT